MAVACSGVEFCCYGSEGLAGNDAAVACVGAWNFCP